MDAYQPRNYVVYHEACGHAQEVLLNCVDRQESVRRHVERAKRRGKCKVCGEVLGDLILIVADAELESTAKADPAAIDLSWE